MTDLLETFAVEKVRSRLENPRSYVKQRFGLRLFEQGIGVLIGRLICANGRRIGGEMLEVSGMVCQQSSWNFLGIAGSRQTHRKSKAVHGEAGGTLHPLYPGKLESHR